MHFDTAVEAIRTWTDIRPKVGVVLGSGLGAFADEVSGRTEIPYAEIPGWPVSTAVGHAGKLVLGEVGHVPVAVMAGRVHLYEGYTPEQVVFGVRTMARLGAQAVIFTNAAGGVNTSYAAGALVLISDHLNLQGANPLVGPNDDKLGPRFPDMSDAYSVRLRERAKTIGEKLEVKLHEGVYAALLGPNYETPAEIRMLRTMGADLVGMSTVPEVLAARHMGLECLAISCVTNMAAGVLPQKINHEEVLETGAKVRGTLVRLLKGVIQEMGQE
jgi:purine-nucleoside phosphorylase